MYQFPMGKVKFQKKREDPQEEKVYQFPMGKVKNNILCCSFSIHHKYSFVNCFYAFQLFHH